jgi:hypothetical protein
MIVYFLRYVFTWSLESRQLKVVDQPPYRLRIIKGLPLEELEEEIKNNSPLPPLSSHLDQVVAFVLTSSVDIRTLDPLKINSSELEVVMVEDLGDEEYSLSYNPPLTGTF